MSKWPVAWAIPADLCNSLGVMEFIKKAITLYFGPPQFIFSENDVMFNCKAVQDLARKYNIQCKCISTYNPQDNGVVEIIV